MNTQKKSPCQVELLLEVLEAGLVSALSQGEVIAEAIDRYLATDKPTAAQRKALRQLVKDHKKYAKRIAKMRREIDDLRARSRALASQG